MLKQWIPAVKPEKEELEKRLNAGGAWETPDADQGE